VSRSHEPPGTPVFLLALAASVAGTIALGVPPLLLRDNVWWLALASVPSLLAAGFLLGWRAREPEPLYGAVLGALYFGIVAGVLFGAELAEALPDPLPGLATGDSTFFFVWPLVILVMSFVGSVVGGRTAVRRTR
jgi:hypothetical protein